MSGHRNVSNATSKSSNTSRSDDSAVGLKPFDGANSASSEECPWNESRAETGTHTGLIRYHALRRVLQRWNFQVAYYKQTMETLRFVHAAFRLHRSYKNDYERAAILFSLVQYFIQKILFSKGYNEYEYTKVNGQMKLIAYAGHDTIVRPLPAFMRIEYIEYRPHRPWGNFAESGPADGDTTSPQNGLVIAGDAIMDPFNPDRVEGTFGALLKTDNGEYFALTAGHVVRSFMTMTVKVPDSSKVITLERKWPTSDIDDDDWQISEVGLLKVKTKDARSIEPLTSRLDIWHYERRISEFDKCGPRDIDMEIGRYESLSTRMGEEDIYVFKQGATTGQTMGKLSRCILRPPPGWYGEPELDSQPIEILFSDDNSSVDKDSVKSLSGTSSEESEDEDSGHSSDEFGSRVGTFDIVDDELASIASNEPTDTIQTFFGVVDWIGPRFSDGGDSGALVHAKNEIMSYL